MPRVDPAAVERLQHLAHLLDLRFRVPGIGWRFGLDGLVIGLVPGIGDAATTLLSAYIILEAWRLGVPRWAIARMVVNVGIDALVGTVPVFGDLFDFGWKANRKNADLVLKHLGLPPASMESKGRWRRR